MAQASSKNGSGKEGWYIVRAGNPEYVGPLLALKPNSGSERDRAKKFVFTIGGVSIIPAGPWGDAEPAERELSKTIHLEDKNTGEKSEKQVPRKTVTDELNNVNPLVRYLVSLQREKGRELDWEYTTNKDQVLAAHAEGKSVYNTLRERPGPDGTPVKLPYVETEIATIPYDGSLLDPFGQPLVGPEKA